MPFLRAALIKRKIQAEPEPEILPVIADAENIQQPETPAEPEEIPAAAEDIHVPEDISDDDNVPEVQEEEEPEQEAEPEPAGKPEPEPEQEPQSEPELTPEPESEQEQEPVAEPEAEEPALPEAEPVQEEALESEPDPEPVQEEPEAEIVPESESEPEITEPDTAEEPQHEQEPEPIPAEPEEPEESAEQETAEAELPTPEPEPEPEQPRRNKDYSGANLQYDFTSGERYVDTVSTKTEFDKMLDELSAISGDLLSHEVEKFAVKFTGKFQGDNDKAEADAKKYEAFLGGYITNAAMILYDNGYRDAAIKRLDQAKTILEARKKLEDETEAIKTRVEEDDDAVDLSDLLGLFGD